jgi:LysM repeat protein
MKLFIATFILERSMSRDNLFFVRIYLALIILATSFIGTSVLAQGATVVRVDPATISAQVNDRVNLPIKIDNVANFTAFEIHLLFDPNVLEVIEVTNGGFIAADFLVQNIFDNAAGTIDYAVAQMNRAPAQGNGTLLNITFRAKSNGNSTVTLRNTQTAPNGLLLSDQNGMAIQASWVSGSVNVGSGSTPVTPTVVSPTPVTPTVVSPTPVTPTVVSPTPVTPTVVSPTPVTPTAISPTPVTPTATTPQSPAGVRVDPSATSVNVNDAFNLFVKIDNASSLSAFELHLSFDPNVLEVKELINGGFVAADVVAQNTFSNTTGTVDYAIAENVRPASQGNGTLLTVVLRAKSAGSSRVDLRSIQTAPVGLLLSDLNGMALPATWTSGSVTVKPNNDQPRIHVVRFGEWLYCIGRAYSVDPMAIAQANGVLWWPYIIFPGQQLTIPNVLWVDMPPTGSTCQPQFTAPILPILSPTTVPVTVIPSTVISATIVPATAIPATATPVPPSACRAVYVVRPGDTMYRIGVSYGVNYAEIARVNQISNARLIYVGQRLCIP